MRQHVAATAVAELQKLNLIRFLQTAPDVDLPPDEKLRELAIFPEPRCEVMNQPDGRNALQRIYREARKYDHQRPWLDHSVSLSILSCADVLSEDDPVRTSLLAESLEICRQGI